MFRPVLAIFALSEENFSKLKFLIKVLLRQVEDGQYTPKHVVAQYTH